MWGVRDDTSCWPPGSSSHTPSSEKSFPIALREIPWIISGHFLFSSKHFYGLTIIWLLRFLLLSAPSNPRAELTTASHHCVLGSHLGAWRAAFAQRVFLERGIAQVIRENSYVSLWSPNMKGNFTLWSSPHEKSNFPNHFCLPTQQNQHLQHALNIQFWKWSRMLDTSYTLYSEGSLARESLLLESMIQKAKGFY